MRDSAIHSRMVPCSASVWPKVRRLERALDHQFERELGGADGAHAVMDAPGPKPRLRQREAAAFLAEEILGRHAHILEQHFAMALRMALVHHRRVAHDGKAGRVARHQHHALALCGSGRSGLGLAHDDEDLACADRRRW